MPACGQHTALVSRHLCSPASPLIRRQGHQQLWCKAILLSFGSARNQGVWLGNGRLFWMEQKISPEMKESPNSNLAHFGSLSVNDNTNHCVLCTESLITPHQVVSGSHEEDCKMLHLRSGGKKEAVFQNGQDIGCEFRPSLQLHTSCVTEGKEHELSVSSVERECRWRER